MPHSKHLIEHHKLGATVAAQLVTEWALRQERSLHHPLPLMVAIQFWDGDKGEALRLARFLAQLEPAFRDDTMIALAGRFDVPMDGEIAATMIEVGRRFPVAFLRSKRAAVGHPDGCYGLWAGTAENAVERWVGGWRQCENVLYVEADGVPARWDWIDHLKRAHAENLAAGKRITGARMNGGRFYESHVNGSMLMHASAWVDRPSWHACPTGVAWDCFHARTMLAELGSATGIVNLYGGKDLTLAMYKTLGANYAWIASVKDDSAWACAQSLIGEGWARLAASVGRGDRAKPPRRRA